MSIGPTPPLVNGPPPVAPAPSESDALILQRLRTTQRNVKGVDIASGLVTLAIGVLGYLLVVAVIDHWLIAGGLSFGGQLLAWLIQIAGIATYSGFYLVPPLRHRINPVFAAATIEQSQPTLKNSLINFLLLRGRRNEVAAPFYQAMERRAADDLTHLDIDVAIDRTHLIRLGCVLAGVLALFAVYLLVSPKNPLRSAVRVLWPWAGVESPTRVTIRDVKPGSVIAFHGQTLTISAEIAGLRDDEQAVVVFSSEDGQVVDQQVPITRAAGEYRYECRFPPEKQGLQQDLRYHLAGGDCRSNDYRIAVQTAPAIPIDKIAYDYPAYTRIADMAVERQGDIRAIEGTTVTIYATANMDIKPNTAVIDLGCDGRHERRMTTKDRTAVGAFVLKTKPDDPTSPEFDSYQLRFSNLQGRENDQPVRYQIEVLRDKLPTIEVVEPDEPKVPVATNGSQLIRVVAEDDYGLNRVLLKAQCGGRELTIPPLLETKSTQRATSGPFSASYTFKPADFGLKPGDSVEYWAEAEDSKEPVAGRSTTAQNKKILDIISADRQRADRNDQKRDDSQESQDSQGGKPNPQQGSKADKASGEGQASPPSAEKQPQDGTEGQSADQTDGQSGDSKKNADQSQQPKDGAKSQPPESGEGNGEGKSQESKQDGSQQEKASQESRQDGSQQEKASQESRQDGSQQEKASQESRQDSSQQEKASQESGENGAKPESGSEQSGQDSAGKSDEKGTQRIDPETAPGDAMQEILKDRQEQQKQSGDQQGEQPKDDSSSDAPKQGQQTGEGQKPQEESTGDPSNNEQQAKGDKSQKDGGKGQQDDKQASQKPSKEQGMGSQGGADAPAPDEQQDEADSADKQSSEGGSDKNKPGKDGSNAKPSSRAPGDMESKKAEDRQEGDRSKSGEMQSSQRDSAGDGKRGDGKAPPAPQDENKASNNQTPKPSEPSESPKKAEDAQLSSESKKQSNSQGDAPGDQSGGGEQGGGQQAHKEGLGGEGTHTPDDNGGSAANEQGQGEVGNTSGDQAKTSKATGSDKQQTSNNGREGEATDETPRGDGQAGKPSPTDQPQGKGGKKPDRDTAAKPSTTQDGSGSSGTPTDQTSERGTPSSEPADKTDSPQKDRASTGGQPEQPGQETTPPESTETPADPANLDYAQRQTELALEHLRDQMAKEKPALLDRLGWTKDDARRFLDRWEQMRAAARQDSEEGAEARKRLNEALHSLGLRPRGTELQRGGTTPDAPQQLRDAGRHAPPPSWAEQFREYTRGVAEGQRKDE